jgi:hypothetical protein
MICHECLMKDASGTAAAGLCRFCFVALCKDHLVELYRNPHVVPQYTCHHSPSRPVHGSSGSAEPSAARVAAHPTGRRNGSWVQRLVPGGPEGGAA